MTFHFRTPITLLVLLVVLVVGLLVGWRLATGKVPSLRESTGSSEPTCHIEKLKAGSQLRARQVTVNVLNAGSTPNLAGDTMRALTRRGFDGGTTGNAPKGVRTGRVLILDTDPKAAQVRLVAKQFAGRVKVRKASGGDNSAAVDVIVGNHFDVHTGINKKAPTSLKVKGTTDVCVPDAPAGN